MQDPVTLEIKCDKCGCLIGAKEFCLMLTVMCPWNGAMRKAFMCRDCCTGSGWNPRLFEHPRLPN